MCDGTRKTFSKSRRLRKYLNVWECVQSRKQVLKQLSSGKLIPLEGSLNQEQSVKHLVGCGHDLGPDDENWRPASKIEKTDSARRDNRAYRGSQAAAPRRQRSEFILGSSRRHIPTTTRAHIPPAFVMLPGRGCSQAAAHRRSGPGEHY